MIEPPEALMPRRTFGNSRVPYYQKDAVFAVRNLRVVFINLCINCELAIQMLPL